MQTTGIKNSVTVYTENRSGRRKKALADTPEGSTEREQIRIFESGGTKWIREHS